MSISFTTNSAAKKNRTSKQRTVIYALGISVLLYVLGVILFSLLKIYINRDLNKGVVTPIAEIKKPEEVVIQEEEMKPSDPDLGEPPPAPPVILQVESAQIAMPAPLELNMDITSTNYGGSGTGMGGLGLGKLFGNGGPGGLGGGVSFFNAKQTGNRFVFIIDHSGSINDSMKKTIQSELSKSLNNFSGQYYQVICFSSNVWFLGDDKPASGKKNKNNAQKNTRTLWLTRRDIPNSLKHLQNPKWGGGTDWAAALNKALSMDPKPDVIYFMTDGVSGAKGFAQKYGQSMRDNRIQLISIGLVNENAAEALKELTEEAKGRVIWAKEGGQNKVIADYTRNSGRF